MNKRFVRGDEQKKDKLYYTLNKHSHYPSKLL